MISADEWLFLALIASLPVIQPLNVAIGPSVCDRRRPSIANRTTVRASDRGVLKETTSREFLDHVLFWNAPDLERRLADFQVCYPRHAPTPHGTGRTPLAGTKRTRDGLWDRCERSRAHQVRPPLERESGLNGSGFKVAAGSGMVR